LFPWIVGTLICSALAIFITPNIIPEMMEVAAEADYIGLIGRGLFIIVIFALVLAGIAGVVNEFVRKYTIQDNHIRYCSLFFPKEFTFDDIEYVELHQWRSRYGETIEWHIYLYGRKRWLAIPSKFTNSHLLLERLKSKNISGAEMLYI